MPKVVEMSRLAIPKPCISNYGASFLQMFLVQLFFGVMLGLLSMWVSSVAGLRQAVLGCSAFTGILGVVFWLIFSSHTDDITVLGDDLLINRSWLWWSWIVQRFTITELEVTITSRSKVGAWHILALTVSDLRGSTSVGRGLTFSELEQLKAGVMNLVGSHLLNQIR